MASERNQNDVRRQLRQRDAAGDLCIKGSAVSAKPWHMVVYEVTDEKLVGRVEAASLPDDWQSLLHGKATQNFGSVCLEGATDWLTFIG